MSDSIKSFYLTPPQLAFQKLKCQFPLFVGGYGSGKSHIMDILSAADGCIHPDVKIGIFAPTYTILMRNTIPRLMATLELIGAEPVLNKTEKSITCRNPQFGTYWFSPMDDAQKIVSVEIYRAYIDELDTLPKHKAEEIWIKIIGRCRQKLPGVTDYSRRASAYTTPEGYEFTYHKWKLNKDRLIAIQELLEEEQDEEEVKKLQKEAKLLENYGFIQAATESNPYLPEDYIPNLLSSYPSNRVQAYLLGEWVNMQTGSVYYAYDREKHRSYETIREGEPLYIGCDFNVHNTSATIYVQRNYGKEWHAVAEYKKLKDTKALIEKITADYKEKGHQITIYPDSAGGATHTTDASISDISLLRQAGFMIRAKAKNPPVKDRINATLVALESNRLFVNYKTCPSVAECLEKQPYNSKGTPDKDSGFDHQNDATTYPIAYAMPIKKPVANIQFEFEKGY